MRIQSLLICLLLMCIPCISLTLHAQPLFRLLSAKETGINFRNEIQENEELNVLAYEYFYNGGGVAAGDLNNDGLVDLYFTANMRPDKIFLNLGNLKFKDITKTSKISNRKGWKTGVSMVDINNDGYLDIYVCYSGNVEAASRRNCLYINNGNLTFTESARSFGLDDPGYSTHAAFFDYDRDGDLDMFLLNHNIKDYKDLDVVSIKGAYDSLAGDKLFMNDNGFFKDVTRGAGIKANPIGFGLGVGISDVNNDQWPDIYVSNDYQEHDYLYINNGDGSFTESSKRSIDHMSEFSMGNDIADFNNDGWTDIITLDMLPEDNQRQKLLQGPENYELYEKQVRSGFHHQFMRNMLHLNNADGTFSEIGQLSGVSNTDWSWSPLFCDVDNDGWKDLLITNGYLRDFTNKDFLKYWGNYVVQKAVKMEPTLLMDLVQKMPSTQIKNYIYKNNGDLTFTDNTIDWGLSQPLISSGALYADLDNDGDLDLVINNINESASVYKNHSREKSKNNFIAIRLRGGAKNLSGIGARVRLHIGSKVQVLENYTSRGFQSSCVSSLNFGTDQEFKIDSVVVEWPSGRKSKITAVAVNQVLTMEESTSLSFNQAFNQQDKLLEEVDSVIMFLHREVPVNDFKRQPLMPWMISSTTPVLAKGDLNHDGIDDFFVGAATGFPDQVFLSHQNGIFTNSVSPLFEDDKKHNATAAIFADFNSDGHNDIYVASGGYGKLNEGDLPLADRIYFNNGAGEFHVRNLIMIPTAKNCVRHADVDGDGDMDLFVGGGTLPGKYPLSSRSYILINDGKGNLTDKTSEIAPFLLSAGVVTDGQWVDINSDGKLDLIIVGQWMPLTVLVNNGGVLLDETIKIVGDHYYGFWNALIAEDMDGDGDPDIIAGNLGLNTQLKVHPDKPIELWFKDFDHNGSIDPLLCVYNKDKSYPFLSRDELLDQLYYLRKKFVSYASYANATLFDIFSAEELADAKRLRVNTVETFLFENRNGQLLKRTLPTEAQFSVVNTMVAEDVNGDGRKDLFLFGNHHHARLKLGRFDANHGTVLINDGNLDFRYLPKKLSGLNEKGVVKDALVVKTSASRLLMLGIENEQIRVYQFKSKKNDP